jgi:hypothetical protein
VAAGLGQIGRFQHEHSMTTDVGLWVFIVGTLASAILLILLDFCAPYLCLGPEAVRQEGLA